MGKLTSYLLAESLRTRHVLSLHKFNELFKDQVTLDIRASLVKKWAAELTKLDIKVPAQAKREARLTNEKAVTDITLVARPMKLAGSSELGRSLEVSPAVKVPYLLSQEERNLVKKRLFDAGEATFKKIIKSWKEAFMRERQDGSLKTDFIIRRDERSVRLLLSSKVEGVEHETPLFYIAIEHGKLNSKVRAHDLVYLGVINGR